MPSDQITICPLADVTCDTYPREIREQRGGYDDQPSSESPDARGASEDAPGQTLLAIAPGSNSEVVPRARWWTFTDADKRLFLRCFQLRDINPRPHAAQHAASAGPARISSRCRRRQVETRRVE